MPDPMELRVNVSDLASPDWGLFEGLGLKLLEGPATAVGGGY